MKSVLKLGLETIGVAQRDGRTHTLQTKRRVSHNTSPLSVEGYTKPSAELEINVDVKYVESWHGLGEMGNMWQILKDKGIEKANRNC